MNDADDQAASGAADSGWVRADDDWSRVIEIDPESPPTATRPDPPRRRVLAVAAALLLSAVAGFVIGDRYTTTPAAQASAPPTPTVFVPDPAFTNSMIPSGNVCAIQIGPHRLQLGGEFTNVSQTPAEILSVEPVVDGGGLLVRTQQWGACAQLSPPAQAGAVIIPAGGSAWYSIMADVEVGCPAATPVQFRVSYRVGGRPESTLLQIFPDLGDVPFTGCAQN